MLLKKRRRGDILEEPFPTEEESPFDDPQEPGRRRLRLPFRKKEPALDLTPIEAGATTIQDILSPTSVDLFGRDYVIVDGVYHAYAGSAALRRRLEAGSSCLPASPLESRPPARWTTWAGSPPSSRPFSYAPATET